MCVFVFVFADVRNVHVSAKPMCLFAHGLTEIQQQMQSK